MIASKCIIQSYRPKGGRRGQIGLTAHAKQSMWEHADVINKIGKKAGRKESHENKNACLKSNNNCSIQAIQAISTRNIFKTVIKIMGLHTTNETEQIGLFPASVYPGGLWAPPHSTHASSL